MVKPIEIEIRKNGFITKKVVHPEDVPMEREYWTIKDLCELMEVNRWQVNKWMRDGKLVPLPKNGELQRKFSPEAVMNFLVARYCS